MKSGYRRAHPFCTSYVLHRMCNTLIFYVISFFYTPYLGFYITSRPQLLFVSCSLLLVSGIIDSSTICMSRRTVKCVPDRRITCVFSCIWSSSNLFIICVCLLSDVQRAMWQHRDRVPGAREFHKPRRRRHFPRHGRGKQHNFNVNNSVLVWFLNSLSSAPLPSQKIKCAS